VPWRPRAAAGRWLSDLRTVFAFLREHRGVPRAAHDRLAALARDNLALVATRLPGATDGPPCAVTVIQPGGAITSVHAGWFGAALPDEREARLQGHAEAVRAAMVALAVALPAVRLVASTSVLLATAVAGVAAYARLAPEAGWRAALFRAAWPFLLPPLLGLAIRLVVRLWLRRQLAHLDGQPVAAGPPSTSIIR